MTVLSEPAPNNSISSKISEISAVTKIMIKKESNGECCIGLEK